MSDGPTAYRLLSATKRRFRFSLRTLLLAFTLLSLWLGFSMNRVRNEHRAAEAIAAATGRITYDWQIRAPGSGPNVRPQPPGPQWLRRYLGPHWFGNIAKVRLNEDTNSSKANKFTVVGPHLVKLPALRSLSLWGGELDQEDCDLLGRLTQIEELSLRSKAVIKPQHTEAIARSKNLKAIKIRLAKISVAAIRELSEIKNLNKINIGSDSYDGRTGLPLTEYNLDDEAARAIAKFPNLRSVMLFSTHITDDGVAALCELSQLETLVVSSPHVTSAVFEHIAQLQHLQHLGTWRWKINDTDFEKLSPMPNLTGLNLQTKLTNQSVPHLLQFKGLETLTMRGEEITDDCVQHLCKLQGLTRLNLSRTSIQKKGEAAKLLKQSLPTCQISLPMTEEEKENKRLFNRSKVLMIRSPNQN